MIPKRNLPRNLYKAIRQPFYALEVFSRRLRSYMSYKILNGPSSFPESVVLLLTFRCNLKCKMCGQWGESGASRSYGSEILKKELSISDYKKLIDEISVFRPRITLTGGEPLMYGQIDQLLEIIKSKRLHCFIITNGVLLDSHNETLIRLGVDEISISIDGPRDIHDSIRGVGGTFDALVKNVKALNSLKRQLGKKKPLTTIVCTISSMNYKRLNEMFDVARELEASVLSFHHLSFLDEDVMKEHNTVFNEIFKMTSSDWAGFVLRDSKIENAQELLAELLKIKSLVKSGRYPFFVNFYPNFTDNEIVEYYTQKRFLPSSYARRCMSPWVITYICPNGEVRPCFLLDYVAGNLNQKSFADIWSDKKYLDFRKNLKTHKLFPACTKCTEFYRY